MTQFTPPPDGAPLTVGLLLTAILGSIPILGIMVWGAVKILGPIGHALARRLGGGAEVPESVKAELEGMHHEIDELRSALAETHERLDFTERLLASSKVAGHLQDPS